MSSKDKTRTSRPKVSVLCITYNQERFIKQTLDGFVMQKTDFPIEIVVADDCSTDKTPNIIHDYAVRYPGLFRVVLRTKNIGSWPNFVDSLKQTKGDYIAICEGDDYWIDPQKLQRQSNYLDTHQDAVICFHPVRVFYENGSEADFIYPLQSQASYFTLRNLLNDNFIQTNSVMYRRQNYNDLPAHIIPGDWYLHLYHAQFGKIGFINRVMAAYRRHQDGLWWAKDAKDFWRRNGLSQLNMYQEVGKLFSRKPEYAKTIQQPINRAFEAILGLPPVDTDMMVEQLVRLYPHMTAQFMKDEYRAASKHRSNLELLLKGKDEHIKKLEAVISKQHRDNEILQVDLKTALNTIEVDRITIAEEKAKRIAARIRHARSRLTGHR